MIRAFLKKYRWQIVLYLVTLVSVSLYSFAMFLSASSMDFDEVKGIPGYLRNFYSDGYIFIGTTLIPIISMSMFFMTEAENFLNENYSFCYTFRFSKARHVFLRVMLIITTSVLFMHLAMLPVREIQANNIDKLYIGENIDYIVIHSVVNIFVLVFFALAVIPFLKSRIFSIMVNYGTVLLLFFAESKLPFEIRFFTPYNYYEFSCYTVMNNRCLYILVAVILLIIFVIGHKFICRRRLS